MKLVKKSILCFVLLESRGFPFRLSPTRHFPRAAAAVFNRHGGSRGGSSGGRSDDGGGCGGGGSDGCGRSDGGDGLRIRTACEHNYGSDENYECSRFC